MPKDNEKGKKEPSLGALALGAFNRFGLEGNYPELRVVPPSHSMIGNSKRIARAVMFESGPEAVYVNKRFLKTDPERMSEYLQHEASHVAAWRKHGPGIREHGREWKDLCQALASNRRVCKPERNE